jgi:hypothetical protein
MPFRAAALAYPAFVAALYFSRPNAVASFRKVNACSPEKSRRPKSLEVPMKLVKKAVKKGYLIPVGDGRFYLDQNAVRKSTRKKMILFVLTLLSFLPLLWLMW